MAQSVIHFEQARKIVELYYKGMKSKDIAHIIQVKPGTIRQTLWRLRKRGLLADVRVQARPSPFEGILGQTIKFKPLQKIRKVYKKTKRLRIRQEMLKRKQEQEKEQIAAKNPLDLLEDLANL
jgi:transposase